MPTVKQSKNIVKILKKFLKRNKKYNSCKKMVKNNIVNKLKSGESEYYEGNYDYFDS